MPASNPKEAKLDSDADKSAKVNLDISATQSALEDVDKCQNDLDSLNEKASEEILAVEQKYNKLRRPHYEKRNAVIGGIPDFWYNTLINHPQIASMLSIDDQECLRCLKSVNVEEFEDIKSGYKITFTFKENSFFSNAELVKEFHLASSGKPETKSSSIEWKEGKDLTKKPAQAKGRKRQFGEHSSFFRWFISSGDPNMDEIAETIKDDIWVNPLQYYLASEIEFSAENGHSDDDDDDEDDLDESVVVIGDDDSNEDDDDDDDEDGVNPEIFEVGDEDDDEDEDDDDDVQEVEGDDDDGEE